jgi:hypothetical protein
MMKLTILVLLLAGVAASGELLALVDRWKVGTRYHKDESEGY